MAFINVAEWTPENVADWLKGLEDSIMPYTQFFLNDGINGCRLLLLTSGDLAHLNMHKIGHQEVVLDAVDLLKHLHYNMGSETLQSLALRLGCKARALCSHLRQEEQQHAAALNAAALAAATAATSSGKSGKSSKSNASPASPKEKSSSKFFGSSLSSSSSSPREDKEKERERLEKSSSEAASRRISTQTLSTVSDILASIKSFISWIDRYPIEGQAHYINIRKTVLKLGIELASTAQRDQFVEKPNEVLSVNCLTLADLCDKIVQDQLNDFLSIQPALLEIVTVKKKSEEEFGMHIHSSYAGVHIVGGVKFLSACHKSGRIECGDEIIQVNYQTVIGWTLKKLVGTIKNFPVDIVLTVKKRPRNLQTPQAISVTKPYQVPNQRVAMSPYPKPTIHHPLSTSNSDSVKSTSTRQPTPPSHQQPHHQYEQQTPAHQPQQVPVPPQSAQTAVKQIANETTAHHHPPPPTAGPHHQSPSHSGHGPPPARPSPRKPIHRSESAQSSAVRRSMATTTSTVSLASSSSSRLSITPQGENEPHSTTVSDHHHPHQRREHHNKSDASMECDTNDPDLGTSPDPKHAEQVIYEIFTRKPKLKYATIDRPPCQKLSTPKYRKDRHNHGSQSQTSLGGSEIDYDEGYEQIDMEPTHSSSGCVSSSTASGTSPSAGPPPVKPAKPIPPAKPISLGSPRTRRAASHSSVTSSLTSKTPSFRSMSGVSHHPSAPLLKPGYDLSERIIRSSDRRALNRSMDCEQLERSSSDSSVTSSGVGGDHHLQPPPLPAYQHRHQKQQQQKSPKEERQCAASSLISPHEDAKSMSSGTSSCGSAERNKNRARKGSSLGESDHSSETPCITPDGYRKPAMGVSIVKRRASNVSSDKSTIEFALKQHYNTGVVTPQPQQPQQHHPRTPSAGSHGGRTFQSSASSRGDTDPDDEDDIDRGQVSDGPESDKEEWDNIVKTLKQTGIRLDETKINPTVVGTKPKRKVPPLTHQNKSEMSFSNPLTRRDVPKSTGPSSDSPPALPERKPTEPIPKPRRLLINAEAVRQSSERLENWLQKYPHLLPPDYRHHHFQT